MISVNRNNLKTCGSLFCSAARVITTRYFLCLFIATLALGLICAGCSGLSTNPSKAAKTISRWVPSGTSEDDITKIMTQHGFVFDFMDMDGHGGHDYHFGYATRFHNWLVQIHTQDGKVVRITVPRVDFDLIQIHT